MPNFLLHLAGVGYMYVQGCLAGFRQPRAARLAVDRGGVHVREVLQDSMAAHASFAMPGS